MGWVCLQDGEMSPLLWRLPPSWEATHSWVPCVPHRLDPPAVSPPTCPYHLALRSPEKASGIPMDPQRRAASTPDCSSDSPGLPSTSISGTAPVRAFRAPGPCALHPAPS